MPKFQNQTRTSRRNQKPENQILSTFSLQFQKNAQFRKNQSQNHVENQKLESQILSTFSIKNAKIRNPNSKIT
jgi:hypothetical protein